jgi:transmembrane sensor
MPDTEKTNKEVSILFSKYLNGSCSIDEAQEMVRFCEDPKNDHTLMNEAQSHWYNIDNENTDGSNPIESKLIMDRILDRLHHKIRLSEEESCKRYLLKSRVFALFAKVAAVLILPLLVYSVYVTTKISRPVPIYTNQVVWQTVKTPTGMQTDFQLPDGSHVWLNSGSVFKYPVPFANDIRQVELTGEAFFDVAKDAAHPFLVKAGKMNIEVKGTRFNVINYQNETFTELILESGSVRLFSGRYNDNKTITLVKPGEGAILDIAQNTISVNKVDVDKYTAWKEGMLVFRDDKMDEVVRKLDRWFNVEIVLQSPELKEYVYTATYRDETLPQILELLKISAPIKYTITDRVRLDDYSFSKRKIIITKRN